MAQFGQLHDIQKSSPVPSYLRQYQYSVKIVVGESEEAGQKYYMSYIVQSMV